MNPLRVGFWGFEGVMALDLVGPFDVYIFLPRRITRLTATTMKGA
jgi:hypothetical protein